MAPSRKLLFLMPAFVLLLAGEPAQAQALAQRNLMVELRSVATAQPGVVSTQRDAADTVTPQMVQVKNGGEASLRLGNTVPVQWVQAAGAQVSTRGASAGGGSSVAGGVVNQLAVLQVGQSLTVKPRWPGGKRPVAVEITLQRSGLDTTGGAPVPSQPQAQLSTTLLVPLDQWITIAASAQGVEQRGVVSSAAARHIPQQIQLRISAP